MISRRRLHANRTNARASTGPRTAAGKTRAAHNALRHGLSLPISSDPARSAEVAALAKQIAGEGASREQQELAVRIAEAQIDLLRVRRARHDLIDHRHGDYSHLSRAVARKRLKILMYLDRTMSTMSLDADIPGEFRELFWPLRGPEMSAAILVDFAAHLSALDRYERRALSRRKFAIRALDAARAG